jgi:hypothetical protein
MKVVNLIECREMLVAWDEVRLQIVRGEIQGLAICAKGWDGFERVTFAGAYYSDPQSALKMAMRVSWNMTQDKAFASSR